MDWSQVISVVLGALLAIGTTFATRLLNDWHEARSKRVRLERFLACELSRCVSKVEAFLKAYKQTHVPDARLLVALERSVDLFGKYRDSVYFLDVETGQRVLMFYDSVDQAIEVIFSMLRLAQQPEHEEYALRESDKQISELEEAYRVGKGLVSRLG